MIRVAFLDEAATAVSLGLSGARAGTREAGGKTEKGLKSRR
jgi:hypothetical protein